MFRSLAPVVAVSVCLGFVQVASAAGRGAALAREMQETGKPALIIAGNEGCVYCRQMAEELATDRPIQPLAQQYLILKVNTESADWPRLRSTFQFEESGIPAVFVVRADGELLYSESGKPADLGAFLERHLESAGTILDAETLRAMQRGLRQAGRHLKRRDYAALLPIVQEHSGSGSYARAALALDAIYESFLAQIGEEASEAEEQISGGEDELEAALSLAELRRVVSEHEAAAEIVDSVWSRLSENEVQASLLEQATILDRAGVLAGDRKWSEAAELYQSVVESAEGSPARAFAGEQLAEVRERARVAAAGERPAAADGSAVSDERAAASHLRFARLYLERDSEKARGYLQRAIQAAPESETAEEARALLEELGDRH